MRRGLWSGRSKGEFSAALRKILFVTREKSHNKCLEIVSQHCQMPLFAPARGQKGGEVIKKDRLPKVTIRGTYYKNRTLPSLNDYLDEIGRHPKAGGKFKADYTKPCISAIRRCLRGWKVTNPPVILHYKFYENKKGKRRDVSNVFSLCAKFFEDALQMVGVIENDNPDWIENFDTEFHWIEDEPYIEIEIEERGKS